MILFGGFSHTHLTHKLLRFFFDFFLFFHELFTNTQHLLNSKQINEKKSTRKSEIKERKERRKKTAAAKRAFSEFFVCALCPAGCF